MMWNDGSWGWGWLPALFIFVMCFVMMARMMSHGGHRSSSSSSSAVGERDPDRSHGAERILADRLARGEIGVEEYERHLAVLQRSRPVGRPPVDRPPVDRPPVDQP